MTVENLWKLPEDVSNVRTPTVILSEQVPFIAEMTNQLIRAYLSRGLVRGTTVSVTLRIEAPALQNYSVHVLNVKHDFASSFPARVRSRFGDLTEDVESEDEMVDVVRNILQSEEMQKILSSLLRESQMQSPEADSSS